MIQISRELLNDVMYNSFQYQLMLEDLDDQSRIEKFGSLEKYRAEHAFVVGVRDQLRELYAQGGGPRPPQIPGEML